MSKMWLCSMCVILRLISELSERLSENKLFIVILFKIFLNYINYINEIWENIYQKLFLFIS